MHHFQTLLLYLALLLTAVAQVHAKHGYDFNKHRTSEAQVQSATSPPNTYLWDATLDLKPVSQLPNSPWNHVYDSRKHSTFHKNNTTQTPARASLTWPSRNPAGFVDGPNLYAYVKQNPWTAWDPDGLWEESQKTKSLREKWEATPVSLTKLGRGLQYAASALNPFDKDSNIRSAGRELPQKIDQAANDLDNAPIPYPMKAMGKFSLGVGGAGANLDPLMAAASLTETAKNVKDKGVVEVVKQTAAGIKNDAVNHPEKLLGGIMVSLAVGKAAAGDKVQVHTNGKEGARLLVGNPEGTQLSLNAYMNNAKIAPGIPGVGFNVLEGGKRIWGLELHRFNGKANAGSMVRLHRHAGETASQISKHRHLFSNETY